MTVEEMTSALENLGLTVIGTRGWEVQASCPGHVERTGHEDRNPSWYINADTGAHICFSCGFKGNFYSLLSYMGGEGFYDEETAHESMRLLARLTRVLEGPKARPQEEVVKVTESMLSAFVEPPIEALHARGITVEAAKKYQILWDRHHNNWIIPVRDPKGTLLGWQIKGYKTRYFNNYPKGMKKGLSIFGIDQYSGGDLIVVESPLDVLRLESVGVSGGVATFGCQITTEQLNVIRGGDRVIFALDNDESGKAASRDMLKRCKELNLEAWFFKYGDIDIKDVGGMSKDEILSGLQNAKHMIHGERAL